MPLAVEHDSQVDHQPNVPLPISGAPIDQHEADEIGLAVVCAGRVRAGGDEGV
jgi:hypothetical protein